MNILAVEHGTYSQNGEDGIIARLIEHVGPGDRTVVEIGAGSGEENNSRALLEQGWRGVLFERRPNRFHRLRARAANWDATVIGDAAEIGTDPVIWRPQVLSLDIDSYDWHVLSSLLHRGFRPAIAVVEYNATLDHDPVSVPYGADCDRVYFGCSLSAWKVLFSRYGYRFVTVCSAGVNAFFLRDTERPGDVDWIDWCDNRLLTEQIAPRIRRRAMIGDRDLEWVG